MLPIFADICSYNKQKLFSTVWPIFKLIPPRAHL